MKSRFSLFALPLSFVLACTFPFSASLQQENRPEKPAKPDPLAAGQKAPAPDDKRNDKQNPAPNRPAGADDQKDKIRLETKLVSLTVTVSDPFGRFVTGLTQENFAVYDDNVQQEIAIFSDEDAPITLGIIYDVSGSMNNL